MSNYPAWWDRTITLYNRYENPVTNLVTWVKTQLTGCFVDRANTRVTVGKTVIENDSTVVRIRKNANYIPQLDWISKPADLREGQFTLAQGDIIVLDAVDDEIDEYVEGSRSTDLIAKYQAGQNVIVITMFKDSTGTARVYPHYHVTGE